LRALDGAELWAVVKANGYGHGAVDVAAAALGGGASALCVATVEEGLELRRELPTARILVLGPTLLSRAVSEARDARLQLDSTHAQVKRLAPGESTGYGRRFAAERETCIGLVPVGYADGFRRSLTGATVRVAGEPRQVVGTISMDSFAVELDRELPIGTPVVLLGGGVSAEDHARIAGTINYELVTGISSDPRRARRTVV